LSFLRENLRESWGVYNKDIYKRVVNCSPMDSQTYANICAIFLS